MQGTDRIRISIADTTAREYFMALYLRELDQDSGGKMYVDVALRGAIRVRPGP